MRTAAVLLAAGLLNAACSGAQSTTAPSTNTVAAPTTTETFGGTLPVGGSSFYSFAVSTNGTVNVTLISVSAAAGVDVPATVMLGLAIGTPSGTGCSVGAVTSAAAGSDAQVTGTYSPGRYCVQVSDSGSSLPAAAAFVVTIAHP